MKRTKLGLTKQECMTEAYAQILDYFMWNEHKVGDSYRTECIYGDDLDAANCAEGNYVEDSVFEIYEVLGCDRPYTCDDIDEVELYESATLAGVTSCKCKAASRKTSTKLPGCKDSEDADCDPKVVRSAGACMAMAVDQDSPMAVAWSYRTDKKLCYFADACDIVCDGEDGCDGETCEVNENWVTYETKACKDL